MHLCRRSEWSTIMKKIVSVIKRLNEVGVVSISIKLALLAVILPAAVLFKTEPAGVNAGARAPQAPDSTREALIARAKSLELNTPYVPPPGDALQHHASGFAKIMCSAVFITGLDPDFAAE